MLTLGRRRERSEWGTEHCHARFSNEYPCDLQTIVSLRIACSAHPVLHYPSTTGVCKRNTPLEKKTPGKIGFQSAKSEAGEQFLLLGRMAKAHLKGAFFHRHRYAHVCVCVRGAQISVSNALYPLRAR